MPSNNTRSYSNVIHFKSQPARQLNKRIWGIFGTPPLLPITLNTTIDSSQIWQHIAQMLGMDPDDVKRDNIYKIMVKGHDNKCIKKKMCQALNNKTI